MKTINSFILAALLGFCVEGMAANPPPPPDYLDMRFCINPTVNNNNVLTAGDLPLSLGFTVVGQSSNVASVSSSGGTTITIPLGATLTSEGSVAPTYCTSTWRITLKPCQGWDQPWFCTFAAAASNTVTFQVRDLNRLNSQGSPIVLTTLNFKTTNSFAGQSAQVLLSDFPGYVAGTPGGNYGYPRNGTCADGTNNCKRSPWSATCSTQNGDLGSICTAAYADVTSSPSSSNANYKGTYSMNLILSGNSWLQSILPSRA
jgi:hypothetical protein